MSRIKIKNFGPLKETASVTDGWIDIKKVTVFTGNQGSEIGRASCRERV